MLALGRLRPGPLGALSPSPAAFERQLPRGRLRDLGNSWPSTARAAWVPPNCTDATSNMLSSPSTVTNWKTSAVGRRSGERLNPLPKEQLGPPGPTVPVIDAAAAAPRRLTSPLAKTGGPLPTT